MSSFSKGSNGIEPINTSIVPAINDYKDLNDFLGKHLCSSKDDKKRKESTNTRIGDKNMNIYGGNYHIPDIEYSVFLQLYYRDVIKKKRKEYLTEKQRDGDGPLVVDLDFRYEYNSVDDKQHSFTLIEELLDLYFDELKKIYVFEESKPINAYVFEKPTLIHSQEKKITKDGIHILIGLQCDHTVQQILRKQVIKNIDDIFEEMPLTNKVDDVFDEGISKGTTNWQLYGSRKPGNEKYELTKMYTFTYDSTDGELMRKECLTSSFNMEKDLYKLSVRYKENVKLYMQNNFIDEYEKNKKNKTQRATRVSTGNNTILNNNITNNIVRLIKNREELELAVNSFLDSCENSSDFSLKSTHEYTMALPESYYGANSYDKWIRVAFALKNTSDRLLLTWINFSAQSDAFNFSDISDLCDKWESFSSRGNDGLTKASLQHWAKKENPEEYKKINSSSLDYYINQLISTTSSKYKPPDNDITKVLHFMFKNEFKCVSIKDNRWYKYEGHRWKKDDSGVTLKQHISGQLRSIFNDKGLDFMKKLANSGPRLLNQMVQDENEDDEKESEIIKMKNLQFNALCTRLGNTNEKSKIMTEAKAEFYDSNFEKNLDTNKFLTCFKNGVVDFKKKQFREGEPDDCLTLCTHINYINLTDEHDDIVVEIHDFMRKLFPEPEVCKYMWEHLASTMLGTTPNQTLNLYIGGGRNGKSVLILLMKKVLGDYANTSAPISILCGERAQTGGTSTELLELKGKRYVVTNEPKKNDIINEGLMKNITSGKDELGGRGLYKDASESFYPQCKIVMATNYFIGVKSDDGGTWRRLKAVPFDSLFTENPVNDDLEKPNQFKDDPEIDSKFESWKEVFASLLVNIAFKTDGYVKSCPIVDAKSKEYRQSQDNISEYIEERIVMSEGRKLRKQEVNQDFTSWFSNNYSGKPPPSKELYAAIDKNFKSKGVKFTSNVWKNIGIQYDQDFHSDDDEDMDMNDNINAQDL